ncbi:MAG: hypothetical protein EPN60_09180 [Nevskiaceae bacterium]|nr:MAG: hypothetical protein EPO48_15970 [Nevskiaceae bacterium]TAM27000.1 MAG: hypothetical protein EPN60_09180 [Nevskiaceae bacterium]
MPAQALIFFGMSLLMGIGAVLLLLRAYNRARRADVDLRLRVLGEDANADELLARSRAQGNFLVRLVNRMFLRAGIDLPPETVAKGLLVAAGLVPLLLLFFGVLAGSLAIGIAMVVVIGVLSRNAARRRAKIVEQLPPFLESVMRVLTAGNTLEESLAAAAREAQDPIRPLFLSIGRQVRLGAPVDAVLAEAGEIHRLRDLKIMALAASINRKYGGSLKQVMKSLITTIRQRDVAARELRALTAETRFSAMVLAIIPVALSFYIFSRNTAYYATMWADASGRWYLVASVVLQIVGVAILFRMMNATEDPDA